MLQQQVALTARPLLTRRRHASSTSGTIASACAALGSVLTETRKCPRARHGIARKEGAASIRCFAGRLGQAENGNVRLAFAVGNRPAGLRVTVDGRRRRRAEAFRSGKTSRACRPPGAKSRSEKSPSCPS